MKSPTSITFLLLCLLSGLENVSASFGFSFGNLMFALHMCKVPGPRCHADCHGPLRPQNYCDHQCSSSSERRLDEAVNSSTSSPETVNSSTSSPSAMTISGIEWSEAACESLGTSSPYYETCMNGATADCVETETDSNAAYVDGSVYSGDTNSANGQPIASRMSYLPWMIAGTVASMFLILYAWRKNRNEKELHDEDLLGDDDDSFHGSVARRIQRATAAPSIPSPPSGNDTATAGYALA
mmetsp:Transcript_10922/g.23138  ORF Transcript_10922/g.23138 Transcript_10922/m.23138 type:complete len:240 (-) Transcript_10922:292-1011(-)|eukprot:CAMPEP_0201122340 /NCGR_PEP_ID=MMETSP0850-20130426/6004_1 /ASSEMBLY_ACC=CAM_ASM_000622 /TAXON_ID=183588 /ORGANISM="Pseudo-nitzschia fraudulenta, Strain WWA7" /LENGTH=239 /DNA_ID=CAMNT_0047389009 /DNA_START=40 /DNA_END=759 /DNA_ORIENTATION=+